MESPLLRKPFAFSRLLISKGDSINIAASVCIVNNNPDFPNGACYSNINEFLPYQRQANYLWGIMCAENLLHYTWRVQQLCIRVALFSWIEATFPTPIYKLCCKPDDGAALVMQGRRLIYNSNYTADSWSWSENSRTCASSAKVALLLSLLLLADLRSGKR